MFRSVSNRKGILGGSQWGGALGFSTFQTPHSVYEDYKLGVEREVTPELQKKFDMGHRLENFNSLLFEELYGVKVTKPKHRKSKGVELFEMFQSERDNRLGCHPDGYIPIVKGMRNEEKYRELLALFFPELCENEHVRIGIECKMRDAFATDKWGTPLTDQIPYDYLMQCYSYMECVGCDGVLLLCFSNNNQIIYVIKRDDSMLDNIVSSLSSWLDKVDGGWIPEAISYKEAQEINSSDREGTIEADEDWHELRNQLDYLNSEKKSFEDQIDALKAEIVTKIGSASAVTYIDDLGKKKNLFTYKKQERKLFDKERLQSEHPEINLEEYQKTITSMVLR